MSKTKLTAAEWELVKDAPYWVQAALAAADKKATPAVAKKEMQALLAARQGYKTSNALVRDILADDGSPSGAVEKASKADADVALGRIAAIVESKLGGDDLDALNDFLLEVGERVAGAAKENVLGLGPEVSKKEAAALKELAVVLRATDAQKQARRENARKEQAQVAQAAQAAQAREEAAATAKAEQARKEAEAKERLEKAREEAEARRKEAEAKERLEKAREEAEARQKEGEAKREAAKAEAEARAREEQARAEAEAKAAAEREAAAKQGLESAPRFTEFIAEHTVVAGDNLSFISQRYYGTQANFRLIYEANKDVIGDNMSLIRPGQVLKIPKL